MRTLHQTAPPIPRVVWPCQVANTTKVDQLQVVAEAHPQFIRLDTLANAAWECAIHDQGIHTQYGRVMDINLGSQGVRELSLWGLQSPASTAHANPKQGNATR
eukprot:gnl/Dysnectes_brevis/8276_a14586_276.p2 GENE.gnl/Dysnectes_brevis/8276_a14586_276~~gnl/Dysnectes_brevis/8276_a14586_276.p2  ORF type:complete len:103 (+),score=10.10 gnl/Dysnectes_brevis/8276_a14586_276:72-380(+)